jgi:hypothetical protein
MKRIGLSLVFAAVLAGCFSMPPATAQSVATLNTVAAAGKQRMLSQRALKAYAQLALNVNRDKASAILASSLEELKTSNVALRATAKDSSLAGLQSQAALIDRLAAVTATPANASAVEQAAQISEDLLNNAETVTQGFIKAGTEAPSAMINLAARQRMLSQRAASAYLVYQTTKSPELKSRAVKAVADFKAAIGAFEDAKAEFPQISDKIEMARIQMIFFDNALSNIDAATKEQFATIATTSERILGEMDSMTSEMVKQLAARNTSPAVAMAKKK